MKTAIYIEDGRTQFVLTPETKIDREVLDEIESTNLKTYRGEFYGCSGGWTRHDSSFGFNLASGVSSERSLIFVIDKSTPNPAEPLSVVIPPCPDCAVTLCGRCYSHKITSGGTL